VFEAASISTPLSKGPVAASILKLLMLYCVKDSILVEFRAGKLCPLAMPHHPQL
jgi:hypothetical protein